MKAPLLTEAHAATYLGLSRQTLHAMRKRGAIPYIRYERAIRYRQEDLDDWLDSRLQNRPA